jgi:hypothetical protein
MKGRLLKVTEQMGSNVEEARFEGNQLLNLRFHQP